MRWSSIGAVFVLAGTAFLLAGCTGGHDGHTPAGPLGDFADLHGLAVHSTRPDELYAATHTGLLRQVAGGDWERVGTSRADLMGFTMHPADGDALWASGHPPTGGNLGVIHSTDGGLTWRALALPGVDFHAMVVSPADPDRLWGVYQGRLYRSDDGGGSWEEDIGVAPYSGLAAHPEDPDTVYGVSRRGLFRSDDAGATFTVARDIGSSAFGINPHQVRTLLLGVGPFLHRSTDGGASWDEVDVEVAGGTIAFFAFHPSDDAVVYLGTNLAGIYRSDDGGLTWAAVREPH